MKSVEGHVGSQQQCIPKNSCSEASKGLYDLPHGFNLEQFVCWKEIEVSPTLRAINARTTHTDEEKIKQELRPLDTKPEVLPPKLLQFFFRELRCHRARFLRCARH